MSNPISIEENFKKSSQQIMKGLNDNETLTLLLNYEDSLFIRFNHGKVRQNTFVTDGTLTASLTCDDHQAEITMPFSKDIDSALFTKKLLAELRQYAKSLPADPYITKPQFNDQSNNSDSNHPSIDTPVTNTLLNINEIPDALFSQPASKKMTGLYTSGDIYRGYADNKDNYNWFHTKNFHIDYSLIQLNSDGNTANDSMVKSFYSSPQWSSTDFNHQLDSNYQLLKKMTDSKNIPKKKMSPKKYDVYLSPSAVYEILDLLAYGSFSGNYILEKNSPLYRMQSEGLKLSPLVTIQENFSLNIAPLFNELGEIAPITLPVIKNGLLKNMLINNRTLKKHGEKEDIESNAANNYESLRSTELLPGTLKEKDILKKLNNGIYISNLHYLNWSDTNQARATGMTRYSCFQVENGELTKPIENLRFDDTIYNLLGNNLVELTDFQELFLNTNTYESRHLGGIKTPGALLKEMNFTL